MVDQRFFTARGPFTLAALAELSGATLGPGADPAKQVKDVASLEEAGSGDISFLDNKKYLEAFAASGAGACLVEPKFAARAPSGMALLLDEEPYRAYALVAQAFYPAQEREPGVAPSAIVDATATIGADCSIAAGAVIAARAEIGARCAIAANAVIGEAVVLGEEVRVGACATLHHCFIGNRVIIHAGARIGQDGFGFAPDPAGHVKVPQLGRVIIEDDAEIGANTTIDRGAGPDTIIGLGSKIDNLVQIAHNVQIGRGCFIVGQVGISGSTKVGDHVSMGGQAGLVGHLHIGEGARIGAQAGIMRDVPAGATVLGSPAVPVVQFHRQTVALARLAKGKGEEK